MKRTLQFSPLLLLFCPALALAQTYEQPPSHAPRPESTLESGGLAPPEPVASDPFAKSSPSSATEQELEQAEREDSGRGLQFFWLDAEVGIEHLGLQTFKAKKLVDAETVATTQTGPLFGAALGVRLVFLTLGARFRLGTFDEWQLWTLNGELGIRIPLGAVEPHFSLGGGYASVGSFDTGNIGADLNEANVDIRGFNLRGGVGLDVFLSDLFSVGANLSGEMLILTRPGVDPSKLSGSGTTTSDEAAARIYAADGSSIGSALTLTAVAGLHF